MALDALALGERPGGVGRYVTTLLAGLAALERPPRITLYVRHGVRQALGSWSPGGPGRLSSGAPFRIAWEQTALPLCARLAGAGLIHGLMGAIPLATLLPRVVTIHDVTFLTHPELHERRKVAYYGALLPLVARAARVVVTDSEASREAIVRELRVAPERVRVVPLAVDASVFHPARPAETADALGRLGVAAPYVLYTGVLEPRKNLPRLVAAMRLLGARGFPHRLVLAGKPGWQTRPIEEALAGAGSRVVRLGYVADADLRALLAGADAFAYVPLAEGFGLPVAEALACGVPVVTSELSSLPEVAGGAALLADPMDPAAIAGALARLLGDASLRADLALRGLRRAAELTPGALARGTAAAWRDALG